jgi:membrane protein
MHALEAVSRWQPLRFEWSLFEASAAAWSAHNAQRLGASLAYYAIFSLAPLLLIIVSIAGIIFGADAVRGEIYWEIRALAGHEGAAFIQQLLKGARMDPASGILATVLGFTMLLLGASGVFGELRDDLNYIWEIPAPQESVWRGMLRYRMISFGLVLGSGLLITASLAASIAIQAAEKFALGYVRIPTFLLETINAGATFLATTLLFGLIYTILPERRVPWTDVAVGSVVTAILFTAGKSLVAIYLGRSGVGSLYGAAGSLVVLLVWVYYSAQIFLFGAEFTHVYSQRHGVLSLERRKRTDAPTPVVPEDTKTTALSR